MQLHGKLVCPGNHEKVQSLSLNAKILLTAYLIPYLVP